MHCALVYVDATPKFEACFESENYEEEPSSAFTLMSTKVGVTPLLYQYKELASSTRIKFIPAILSVY